MSKQPIWEHEGDFYTQFPNTLPVCMNEKETAELLQDAMEAIRQFVARVESDCETDRVKTNEGQEGRRLLARIGEHSDE